MRNAGLYVICFGVGFQIVTTWVMTYKAHQMQRINKAIQGHILELVALAGLIAVNVEKMTDHAKTISLGDVDEV